MIPIVTAMMSHCFTCHYNFLKINRKLSHFLYLGNLYFIIISLQLTICPLSIYLHYFIKMNIKDIKMNSYYKVKLFICTGRLINKDYRYLYKTCVETGLSRALTLNSACVAKNA